MGLALGPEAVQQLQQTRQTQPQQTHQVVAVAAPDQEVSHTGRSSLTATRTGLLLWHLMMVLTCLSTVLSIMLKPLLTSTQLHARTLGHIGQQRCQGYFLHQVSSATSNLKSTGETNRMISVVTTGATQLRAAQIKPSFSEWFQTAIKLAHTRMFGLRYICSQQ